jgi:hypothetical protein
VGERVVQRAHGLFDRAVLRIDLGVDLRINRPLGVPRNPSAVSER